MVKITFEGTESEIDHIVYDATREVARLELELQECEIKRDAAGRKAIAAEALLEQARNEVKRLGNDSDYYEGQMRYYSALHRDAMDRLAVIQKSPSEEAEIIIKSHEATIAQLRSTINNLASGVVPTAMQPHPSFGTSEDPYYPSNVLGPIHIKALIHAMMEEMKGPSGTAPKLKMIKAVRTAMNGPNFGGLRAAKDLVEWCIGEGPYLSRGEWPTIAQLDSSLTSKPELPLGSELEPFMHVSSMQDDGTISVPEYVQKTLGLQQNGGVVFLIGKDGHYRMLSDAQWSALVPSALSASRYPSLDEHIQGDDHTVMVGDERIQWDLPC